MQISTIIIIVHYGQPETTLRCLSALSGAAHKAKIIISNNDRSDHADIITEHLTQVGHKSCLQLDSQILFDKHRLSAHHLTAAEDASIIILNNGSNKGFASGCNRGLILARKIDHKGSIWLLNNDTLPEANALKALQAELASYPDSIIGSSLLYYAEQSDRSSTIQVGGGVRYQPWSSRIHPNHSGANCDSLNRLPETPMDYIYGASFFCSFNLFKDVGLFDEWFFLFYEELDLCLRAKNKGYSLRWCRNSLVTHDVSATIGNPQTASTEQKMTAAYHEARSTVLFTRKHYKQYLIPILLLRGIVKPILLSMRGEFRSIPSALRGLWNGLRPPGCRR